MYPKSLTKLVIVRLIIQLSVKTKIYHKRTLIKWLMKTIKTINELLEIVIKLTFKTTNKNK